MSYGRTARLRLAVDAAALVRDRRGMGRVVRAVLREAMNDSGWQLTLLAGRRDVPALQSEFPDVPIRSARTARQGGRYNVAWFPFNGMRFTSRAPALVTVHDVFAFTEPHREPIARFREQMPIRRAARRAARIVAVSAWTAREAARELQLDEATLAVVRSAPDAYFFAQSGDALPLPLAAKRFVLLVGARERRKNARLAIEASSRALRASERLVVVGSLSDADRDYARGAGLIPLEVTVSDPTLRCLYRNAGVVLVPSYAEGFGLVAVEALACGAPVLASDRSALPEATAGAAELLDPTRPDDWAAAIRALLDEPERAARLGLRGATHFALLDRNAFARETLALLRETAQIRIDRRARS